MPGYKYYILDVFAETKYSGNQLAVFCNYDGEISDDEMQKIAREINFSETTFINSDKITAGGFDVRIFTPMQEVPFAGHPTLGTAFIINKEIMNNSSGEVKLNLKVGQIPVKFENDILTMKQISPEFGNVHDKDAISEILQVNVDEIDDRYPVQEVSTGLPTLIIPLKKSDTLRNIKINKQKYFDYVKDITSKPFLVFCPNADENDLDLRVRVFVNWFGIPEDPATGSSNGCLAGYLVKHKYYGKDKIKICVGQGDEINRPSKLYLESEEKADGIHIYVGGKVIKIAEGIWGNS